MESCPFFRKNEPVIDQLKEHYKDRGYNDFLLGIFIQTYREHYETGYDWMPQDDADMKSLIWYIDNMCFKNRKDTPEADILSKYENLYNIYTPEQLDDRINTLDFMFSLVVDSKTKESPNLSRQDVILKAGSKGVDGYTSIMNEVFDLLAKEFLDVDARFDREVAANHTMDKDELRDALEYQTEEVKKMIDNKDILTAVAATRIGINEGFSATYRGLGSPVDSDTEVSDAEGQEESENNGEDPEESVKGDRYVDFRITKLEESISPQAKVLLRKQRMVDSYGNPVTDDIGFFKHMNVKQAAITLNRVLVNSSPESFMRDLKDAASSYPWIENLVRSLEQDTDVQTVIYVNFKKAAYSYITTDKESYGYHQRLANTRAAQKSLTLEAGANITSGFVLDDSTSLYLESGYLRSKEAIDGTIANFEAFRAPVQRILKYIDMVQGDAPFSKDSIEKVIARFKEDYGVDASYLRLSPAKAMEAFLEANPHVPAVTASYLRGMGYAVSADDIKAVALQEMTPKSYKLLGGDTKRHIERNKLYQLLTWMGSPMYRARDIHTQSKSGKGVVTGQYLFNTCSDGFSNIDKWLSLAKYNELEHRTVQGKKALSTYNNVNLLHQVVDELNNASGIDENQYQENLYNNYLRYEGMSLGFGDKMRATGWLEIFRTNLDNRRKNFRVYNDAGFNNVEYSRLSSLQKMSNSIIKFFAGEEITKASGFTLYEVPIQADYESAYDFISAPKLSMQEVIDALCDEVAIEIERIAAIEQRKDDKSYPHPRVYDAQGSKFLIFDEFNHNGFLEKYKNLSDAKAEDFLREQVTEQLGFIINKDFAAIDASNALVNPNLRSVRSYDGSAKKTYNFYTQHGLVSELSQDAQDAMAGFCANVFYARLQMTKIFTGGLANFNGLIDYEKRNMMIHAPHTSLYTKATYKGKPIRKNTENIETQNVVYINDDSAKSDFYNQISILLKGLLDKKVISNNQYERMLEAYGKIKTTDGVGLRTLDSYREVILMSNPGMWTDAHEAAYKRIKDRQPKRKDIDLFMQGIKPIYSGYETLPASTAGDMQKPVRLTVLHKYAEEVLLPVALADYCLKAKSVPMQAISGALEELENKHIDLVLFNSAVKVGGHSSIDPFAKEDNDPGGKRLRPGIYDIKDYIVKEVNSNAWTVHTLPYKYFGIAASTPAHAANEKIAMASQAEKGAWADIKKGDKLILNGEERDAEETRKLYYDTKTADIVESYKELRKLFANKYELENLLLSEIANTSYASPEVKFALSLLAEEKEFALPLYAPNVEHQVQALLTSVIRKRLTKQKNAGANILQATGLGMDMELSSFDNENALSDEEKLGFVFDDNEHPTRPLYVEVTVPLIDNRLRQYADEAGAISAERLNDLVKRGVIPESLLYFIAYRTPSDAAHSVIPCRIKAFTANIEGATIKMPKEVMVLTGHDYDGDKMRCHFKTFSVEGIDDASDSDLTQVILGSKKMGDLTPITVPAYDYNKTAIENSKEARYNARLDMMFAQLTSAEGSMRWLIPGGSNETKILAKTMQLCRMAAQQTDVTNEFGERDERKASKLRDDVVKAYKNLRKQTDDYLSAKLRDASSAVSPFSLAHSLEAYEYIIRNSGMIGTYATYNSTLQMLQRLNLHYIPKVGKSGEYKVTIFGHTMDKLFDIENRMSEMSDAERKNELGGSLLTLALARLLNAAVDNGKDPILGYLNQSREMAAFTFLFLAAGYTEEDVHLLMNQPAIVEVANRIRTSSGSHKLSVGEVASDLVELLASKSTPEMQEGIAHKQKGQRVALNKIAEYGKDDFIRNIATDFNEVSNTTDIDLLTSQIAVLQLFAHLSSTANQLSSFVSIVRPETDSGSIGMSIADMQKKVAELADFRTTAASESVRISGMQDIIKKRKISEGWSEERLFDAVNSELPEVTSLLCFMTDSGLDMFSTFFPQAKASWTNTAISIAERYDYESIQEGALKKVGRDMILWKLLSDKNFIKGDLREEQKQILFGDKKKGVKGVPERIINLKDRIRKAVEKPGTDLVAESFEGNPFLERIGFTSPENAGYYGRRIMFDMNINQGEDTIGAVRHGWYELSSSSSPEIRQLAQDIFKYGLFTSGLSFGRYELITYAPFSLMYDIPGFMGALRNVIKSDWKDETEAENFMHYYYMNRWFEDKLVPQLNADNYLFKSRDGEPKGRIHVSFRSQKEASAFNKPYVLLYSGFGKDRRYAFYRSNVTVEKDAEGVPHITDVFLDPAPMLGEKNYHSQITMQYNPRVDYTSASRIIPDETAAETNQKLNANAMANINAPGQRESGIDGLMQASMLTGVDANEMAARERAMASIFLSTEALDQMANFNEQVSSVDDKNDKQLGETPERGEIDLSGNPSTGEASAQEAAAQNSGANESLLISALLGRDVEVQDQELLEKSKKNNGPLYHIVERDDKGNPVANTYSASPWSIRQARKQRAYRILHDRLLEILRKNGVGVGVLTEAEARMGLGGVTDFDTAAVTTEGLKELIRLFNDPSIANVALPEEFAHVALAMLGDNHPLVKNLIDALSSNEAALNEAFDGQFDEYIKRYGVENRDKLVVEAAGKLVAKQLLREQEIESSSWIKKLVLRVIDAIRRWFRTHNLMSDINAALYDASQAASAIARGTLYGNLSESMELENITQTGKFDKIHKDLTGKEDILNKLLKVELKRLDIFKKRMKNHPEGSSDAALIAVQTQIAMLEKSIKDHKLEEAIVEYITGALDFIKDTEKSLDSYVDAKNGYTVEKICKKLQVTRDTLDSFSSVLSDINEAIIHREITDSQNLSAQMNALSGLLESMYKKCDFLGQSYFEEMLSSVYGKEGIKVNIGHQKGRVISIKEIGTRADNDISFMSRWFNSLADTGDFVLRAIDDIVRNAKWTARTRANSLVPKIETAVAELEKATGSRDQTFMFQYKTVNGKKHKTGQYITEEQAKNLPEAQRKFYHTMMEIKKEADACLPVSRVKTGSIVMLRKYAYEKYRDSEGMKGKLITSWEILKNSIMETGDDADTEYENVSMGFNNNRIDSLPVKFVEKGKNETYDDMTDDVATSIMTYAGMAFEYNEMNGVIGTLENARYMSAKRDVVKRVGLRQQLERIGNPEKDTYSYRTPYTVKQARTHIQEAMDDFFQMHIYNHIQKNEGPIGRTKISKRKLVNAVNNVVSLSQMALNLPQRVANVNTGLTMIGIETAGKGKFNAKDAAWGAKIWMKNTSDRFAETGKTDYDNKLSRFIDYFDILQNNGRDIPNYQRGRASRVFNSHALYAGMTIGEDFLASVTALAVARNFKVKNAEGKVETLWDAYEVKYNDPKNKVGAYLALKSGYTKADGTPITKEDEVRYAKEVIGLNFEMQGIYNLDDRSAIQQYSAGALLIMYRKWIAPALKRRYQGLFSDKISYSLLKGDFEEGYYTTLVRFLGDSFKTAKEDEPVSEEESQAVVERIVDDIKGFITSVQVNWNKMTPYEQSNVKRACTELSIVLGLFAAAFLLTKLPPDDHDGNEFLTWADNFMVAQILRLRTEIGSQAPTPRMLEEGLRILNSPFAAIGPVRDSLKIFQLAIPRNYFEEVQSGRYKGHSKAYKYFRELPIISMFKKVDNFIDPSPLIQYYKNDAPM